MMLASQSGPILVPVDFSEDSRAALLDALFLAHCFQKEIIVLHVVHDPSHRPGFYTSTTAGSTVMQTMEEAAEQMMQEFLAEESIARTAARYGVAPITQLAAGLPVTQILRVAEREGVALIVMGSRGLTGLSRLLLGSKAERVVQLSPIPVMVVKAERAETLSTEQEGGS